MINIGLLGFGTVGTGIVEILKNRQEQLCKLTGHEVRIKKILVKNIDKKREIDVQGDILTDDFNQILNDNDIGIVIEATGDLEQSYQYITESLKAGKHVVTANKAVVSKYFEELSNLADENSLAFLYEASVGGGIPVLKPLKEQVALNEIIQVKGILNGTCNYILTRMVEEGLEYDEALKSAQELGYAELDPTADVEGIDTQRKTRILGSLALKDRIVEEDIILNGISNITAFDIEMIKSMNSTIKLIGEIEAIEDGYTAIVQPTIVESGSYFSTVNMEFNGISIIGGNVGEINFYGAGAGKLPTANAVLSDVLDILIDSYRKENPLGKRNLKNLNSTIKGEYYLRISDVGEDVLHIMESIATRILAVEENIAIITKNMLLSDITNLLEALQIEKNNYFLARRS